MKKVVFASVLALAGIVFATAAPIVQGQDASGQITIKDQAEYNAYANAMGQSDPKAKAAAIESFLQTYPQSVVKRDLLETLMATYQQLQDLNKTQDVAARLLQVDPNNLRALAISVYIKKSQASQKTNPTEAQPLLDDAAALAHRGLAATKPANLPQASFDQLKNATAPIFHSAIALDDVVKKNYPEAIQEFRAELQATPVAQTTTGPVLFDTYQLGTAYVQQDQKDALTGSFYLARAASYFTDPNTKAQIDTAAKYWYKKYHGTEEGYVDFQLIAAANLFPPATLNTTVTQAPPPPSPKDLAHQVVTGTGDLKTLALSDKEFILANGSKEDADKLWDVLKDVTTEVPGQVIEVTDTQIKLAVTEDAKNSKTPDFTVNMKEPLKTPPAIGAEVKLIATFDSYTQTPAQILMKDGELPAAKPAAHKPTASRPVHRTTK